MNPEYEITRGESSELEFKRILDEDRTKYLCGRDSPKTAIFYPQHFAPDILGPTADDCAAK